MATPKLKGFSYASGNVKASIHFRHMNRNLARAQFALDTQIMNDMTRYMPKNTGALIALTRARSITTAGTGLVCAAAGPSGRFLYNAKVMVDPVTGSPWARKGAKKVVIDRPLNYSNPQARPKWFEVAKEKDLNKWVRVVKKEAGK